MIQRFWPFLVHTSGFERLRVARLLLGEDTSLLGNFGHISGTITNGLAYIISRSQTITLAASAAITIKLFRLQKQSE